MSRRPTLSDIARESGVSKATVSKVLNRRGGFSADTARRVEQAMTALNYVPITRDRLPRASGAVVAVFDTLYTLYSLRVLEGLTAAAQKAGVDLLVRVTDPDHSGAQRAGIDARAVRSMADKGHIGAVVVTTALSDPLVDRFREYGLPLVSIDASAALRDDVWNVSATHWRGGRQAAEHLATLGHRRIAFVGGSRDNPAIRERLSGFRDELTDHGITLPAERVLETGLMPTRVEIATILEAVPRPTAVFASTDGAAVETIAVARALGIRVPEELSVIGYDDSYSPSIPGIELTSISAPLEDIGATALESLLRLVVGTAPRSSDLHLATILVARRTTAIAPER